VRPVVGPSHAADAPQREPREEAGDLHHDEGTERRVVVERDRVGRHPRLSLERFGRRLPVTYTGSVASAIRNITSRLHLLQVIVLADEREQKETEAENRPDRREVVQQQNEGARDPPGWLVRAYIRPRTRGGGPQ